MNQLLYVMISTRDINNSKPLFAFSFDHLQILTHAILAFVFLIYLCFNVVWLLIWVKRLHHHERTILASKTTFHDIYSYSHSWRILDSLKSLPYKFIFWWNSRVDILTIWWEIVSNDELWKLQRLMRWFNFVPSSLRFGLSPHFVKCFSQLWRTEKK